MPLAAAWMDLEIVILSKISQRKTNIIWYHIHVEPKENDTMNWYTKLRQTHGHRKQFMIAKGESVEGSTGSLGLKYTHYYV